MSTLVRRLAAVATTTAVAAGATLVAPPAQAARNDYAASAATWLSRQLTSGVAHNAQFDFDDYGLSLDIFFALKSLDRPAAASTVIRALRANPQAYIQPRATRSAGGTGKLATAVELNGGTPRSFGGVNLIGELQSLLTSSGAQRGRAVDRGPDNFTNTIGQAWVVRALAAVDSPRTGDAIGFLLRQQCAAGFFREDAEPATGTTSTFRCDAASPAATGSVDSTALALQALVSARADGATGLDDDIADAATWLVGEQRTNGSFVGNDVANTNTTGLAAAALAVTGRTAPARRAAAYVSRLQVNDLTARRYAGLRRELGAIAYDPTALAAGRRDGIPVDQRDQWRRATAQAAIGVNALPRLRLTLPDGFVHAGTVVRVRLNGLRAGEGWTVRLGTAVTVQGDASATGSASVRIAVPRGTHAYVVRATGVETRRTGSAVLRALGARRLGLSLRHTPAHRGSVQRVTVSRLAVREPVRIFYRGVRVFAGKASATGRVTHSFRVGTSLGKKSLRVRGAFADRKRVTYFRVVR